VLSPEELPYINPSVSQVLNTAEDIAAKRATEIVGVAGAVGAVQQTRKGKKRWSEEDDQEGGLGGWEVKPDGQEEASPETQRVYRQAGQFIAGR
jgi:hypothetical protein